VHRSENSVPSLPLRIAWTRLAGYAPLRSDYALNLVERLLASGLVASSVGFAGSGHGLFDYLSLFTRDFIKSTLSGSDRAWRRLMMAQRANTFWRRRPSGCLCPKPSVEARLHRGDFKRAGAGGTDYRGHHQKRPAYRKSRE